MDSKKEIQHVYLVGAKSLGAYGGYETFVYKLTEYHQNKENIKYHVACKANGDGCMDETKFDGVTKINDHEFEFHNAHCFKIDVPQIGPAQAIYYDVAALKACCEHIKENHIPHPIVYIMACRIGPFAGHFYREIHKLGGTVFLNPDGHEWMRAKWSAPIRKYWKISEQMMVKYCDLTICDSVNIEKYIHECYDGKGIKGSSPKTTFIAYGADQDDLYTVDLICHGSPSPELLKMYLKEKSVDIEELEGLNFREKTSFGLRSVGKNNGFPRIVDMYTYAFLKSIDYTENCYSCRYASQSRVSDISLGDSWGSELSEEEKKKGISLVLCQTKKGEELLKKSNVELFDADITRAIQLNHQLEYPSRIPSSRMFFFENLEKGFDFAMKKILPKEYLKNEIKIILSKVGIRR